MKRPLILTLIASLFALASFAQNKPLKALETAKIKTPNVLCEDCKKRLTTYLDRYDGIQSTVVNFRKGEVTVKYWTDRIDIEQIKTAIANAGYDADDVPAEESAYKRLPKTCKKAEDGGGHPKPKETPVTPVVE
ncbi:MAG: copper chaperone [Chitinophagaceae bacterium]|nr:MAG: copper chaperone [Chitinophagaceae bacterium]